MSKPMRWFDFQPIQPGFRVEGESIVDDRFSRASRPITSAGAQRKEKRRLRAGKSAARAATIRKNKIEKVRVRELADIEDPLEQ